MIVSSSQTFSAKFCIQKRPLVCTKQNRLPSHWNGMSCVYSMISVLILLENQLRIDDWSVHYCTNSRQCFRPSMRIRHNPRLYRQHPNSLPPLRCRCSTRQTFSQRCSSKVRRSTLCLQLRAEWALLSVSIPCSTSNRDCWLLCRIGNTRRCYRDHWELAIPRNDKDHSGSKR